jgi:hypothetical protein
MGIINLKNQQSLKINKPFSNGIAVTIVVANSVTKSLLAILSDNGIGSVLSALVPNVLIGIL